jgi:hypothetical protein
MDEDLTRDEVDDISFERDASAETDESELKDRGSLGGAPDMPAAEEDTLEKCRTDREDLAPKETALCAGLSLAELSENEEDGGS